MGSDDPLVAVVNPNRVDGTGPGGHLRVELLALGDISDEHVGLPFLAVRQVRFPGVLVPLEGVPLRDALEHADTDVAVVLHAHILNRCGALKWVALLPTV